MSNKKTSRIQKFLIELLGGVTKEDHISQWDALVEVIRVHAKAVTVVRSQQRVISQTFRAPVIVNGDGAYLVNCEFFYGKESCILVRPYAEDINISVNTFSSR